jgi:hypothetical protein
MPILFWIFVSFLLQLAYSSFYESLVEDLRKFRKIQSAFFFPSSQLKQQQQSPTKQQLAAAPVLESAVRDELQTCFLDFRSAVLYPGGISVINEDAISCYRMCSACCLHVAKSIVRCGTVAAVAAGLHSTS